VHADYAPEAAELLRILPEMALAGWATLLMVLSPLARKRAGGLLGYLGLAGFVMGLAAAAIAHAHRGVAFGEMVVVDDFATFFRMLTAAVGGLTVLSSLDYLRRERPVSGEYYALLLYSAAGQSLMASSGELITIFIGLEISSIASYVLVGCLRDDKLAAEAALKYFLLGSLAAAFLLYGVAWVYGLTGSTNLVDVRAALWGLSPGGPQALTSAAAALLFVGLAFKVAAWPFQSWAPDVYQGAPAPVAGFLSAGPKAAAFAVLLRVFWAGFGPIRSRWDTLLWLSALLTMAVGNFAALRQTNLKRMLGYSSIAHAGYVLVAVAAQSAAGVAAVMFYLAAYACMNLGAFAVAAHVGGRGEKRVEIADLAGLSVRRPEAALLLALFLLSMIGVPLTGGFLAKFYAFKAAIEGDLIWLTALGLLMNAVAAYYYLRVLVVMYMQEAPAGVETPPLGGALRLALYMCALATVALGVVPSLILSFAESAARTL